LAPVLIDLQHLGRSRVIASYLLAGDEPALVDCGPTSCLAGLEAGLAGQGLGVEDLRHLLLTHIHLDHAGAAGALVRRNPGLHVYVSEIGAPHLVDPSRLEASARRLYADDFDRLWGELVPVPEENVHVVGGDVLGLEAWPTPGHASHHVSYLSQDGTCYSGDVTGVVIAPSTLIAPVCPPPDVDLEAWELSLDSIAERRPERLCLPHFGVVEEPAGHIQRTRERLRTWAERVRGGAGEEEFVRAVEEELQAATDPETAAAYTQAGPLWQSYAGLVRYFAKKGEAAPGQGATL
jgi:glyoxylase-like metal-dependent hydrolase (beta-lactamase superfamily II)